MQINVRHGFASRWESKFLLDPDPGHPEAKSPESSDQSPDEDYNCEPAEHVLLEGFGFFCLSIILYFICN